MELIPFISDFIQPAAEELQCDFIEGYSDIELKILSRVFCKIQEQPLAETGHNEHWKLEFTSEERELLRKFVKASDY